MWEPFGLLLVMSVGVASVGETAEEGVATDQFKALAEVAKQDQELISLTERQLSDIQGEGVTINVSVGPIIDFNTGNVCVGCVNAAAVIQQNIAIGSDAVLDNVTGTLQGIN